MDLTSPWQTLGFVVCSLYLVDPPRYLDDGELPALHGLAQGVDLGQVGVLPHQPVQLRRQLRVVVVVSQLHIWIQETCILYIATCKVKLLKMMTFVNLMQIM